MKTLTLSSKCLLVPITTHDINKPKKKEYSFTIFKSVISIFVLIIISGISHSGSFKQQILSEKINEAILIVKGTLTKKYSKMENIVDYVTNGKEIIGEIPSSIYTTFVFAVDDVLKGNYFENVIEIKMLGGCDGTNCEEWAIGYSFDINEKAVLFLHYDEANKIYRSTQASSTVFHLKKSGELISKSHHFIEDNEIKTNLLVPDKGGKMILLKKFNISFLISEINKSDIK